MTRDTLADALNLRESALRELNPALADSVWSGDKIVPKGFKLRVPHDTFAVAEDAARARSTRRSCSRSSAQDQQHRVRRGDTLSQIATEYHVSLAALMRVNGLGAKDMIRVGQLINLPVDAQGARPRRRCSRATSPKRTAAGVVRRAGRRAEARIRSAAATASRASRSGSASIPTTLLAANSIKNGNLIVVGQTLRVPGNEELEPAAVLAANDTPAAVAITSAAAVLAPTPAGAAANVIGSDELEAALAPGRAPPRTSPPTPRASSRMRPT